MKIIFTELLHLRPQSILTSNSRKQPKDNTVKQLLLILLLYSLSIAKDSTAIRLETILKKTSRNKVLSTSSFIMNDPSYANNRYFELAFAKGESGIVYSDIMAAAGFAFSFVIQGDTLYAPMVEGSEIYLPQDRKYRVPVSEYEKEEGGAMILSFLKVIKLFYDGNKAELTKNYTLSIPEIKNTLWEVEATPRNATGTVKKMLLMGGANIDSVRVYVDNEEYTFSLGPYSYQKKLTKDLKKMFRPRAWKPE